MRTQPSHLVVLPTFSLFSLFAVLFSLTHVLSAAQTTGFTLDPCQTNEDCWSPRFCGLFNDDTQVYDPCPASSRSCVCTQRNPQDGRCSSTDPCDEGERCIDLETNDVCLSCRFYQPVFDQPDTLERFPPVDDGSTCPFDGDGFTGDLCRRNNTCVQPRTCVSFETETFGEVCRTSNTRCACLDEIQSCTNSSDCAEGDRCIRGDNAFCFKCEDAVSPGFEATDFDTSQCKLDPDFTPSQQPPGSDEPPTPSTSPTPSSAPSEEASPIPSSTSSSSPSPTQATSSPTPSPTSSSTSDTLSGSGLTGEPCSTSAGCKEPRECISAQCVSADHDLCREDNDICLSGDRCASVGNEERCMSCKLVEEQGFETIGLGNCDEDTSPPPCVDARALAHLPASALVFAEARRAPVLCDAAGSCATAAHMVVVDGAGPMTMQRYCARAGSLCRRTVAAVNSPRMRWGLRVASRTKGLAYTALAARYGSRVEEHALAALVRIGA